MSIIGDAIDIFKSESERIMNTHREAAERYERERCSVDRHYTIFGDKNQYDEDMTDIRIRSAFNAACTGGKFVFLGLYTGVGTLAEITNRTEETIKTKAPELKEKLNNIMTRFVEEVPPRIEKFVMSASDKLDSLISGKKQDQCTISDRARSISEISKTDPQRAGKDQNDKAQACLFPSDIKAMMEKEKQGIELSEQEQERFGNWIMGYDDNDQSPEV